MRQNRIWLSACKIENNHTCADKKKRKMHDFNRNKEEKSNKKIEEIS